MKPMASQRGASLILTLLFLIVISLLTVTSFNSSTTNLQVTGNMMARNEATAAAQIAIERTLSNSLFTTDAVAVAATPQEVDIDGDGTADYVATLAPAPKCYRVRTIKSNELDITNPSDAGCFASSVASTSGIESSSSSTAGDSLCANTDWNIRAAATDARTGTQVAVNQGVGVRILAADAENACK